LWYSVAQIVGQPVSVNYIVEPDEGLIESPNLLSLVCPFCNFQDFLWFCFYFQFFFQSNLALQSVYAYKYENSSKKLYTSKIQKELFLRSEKYQKQKNCNLVPPVIEMKKTFTFLPSFLRFLLNLHLHFHLSFVFYCVSYRTTLEPVQDLHSNTFFPSEIHFFLSAKMQNIV
jgi:hypothetical protein